MKRFIRTKVLLIVAVIAGLLVITISCQENFSNTKPFAFYKGNFSGITTSKGTEKNLFPIKVTGVSTAPIKEMADQFLESLNEQQRSKTTFDIQDEEWFKWSKHLNIKGD